MKLTVLFLVFISVPLCLSSQNVFEVEAYDLRSNSKLDSIEGRLIENETDGILNSDNNLVFFTPVKNQDNEPGMVAVTGQTIAFNYIHPVTVSVFNELGKLVSKSLTTGKYQVINMNHTESGIYVIKVEGQGFSDVYYLNNPGNKLLLGKPHEKLTNTFISLDSLILTRNGYFTRSLKADFTNSRQKVKMVKQNYNDLDCFTELPDKNAFNHLKNLPAFSFQSDVESVKIIYDTHLDSLFFVNSKKYKTHYAFASGYLDFVGSNGDFNNTQYTSNPDRYLFGATLNYYKNLESYVLNFFPMDAIDCDGITRVYNKIIETSDLKGNLFFHPDQPKWDNCNGQPTISTEKIYESQKFQAMNPGEGYGYLKKVKIEGFSPANIYKHDLVILNGLPNDIPVCSGIITSVFQTPLSHINVLCHNRGTPNMVLVDVFEQEKYSELEGELVYFKVMDNDFVLEEANISEAQEFWSIHEPRNEIVLDLDTLTYHLVNLNEAGLNYVNRIGGKAANFAELIKIMKTTNLPDPLPEGACAIPFYYYNKHMRQSGASAYLKEMLNDQSFYQNMDIRNTYLENLRRLILNCPIDTALLQELNIHFGMFPDFERFRFRSSTNAEDLEEFSGAGLYESYVGIIGEEGEKSVGMAIKKVWGGLWNLRAFEEREYYKVNQLSVAMGILVHRSFPDEDANGVMITKNLYNGNHGFVINAQYKEYSIVSPELGITHDQVILYTLSFDKNARYSIQYISKSNIPYLQGNTVLSDQELYLLGDYGLLIKKYYYDNYHSDVDFSGFAMEIEFKVDSEYANRKIYIKQARPYN